MFDNILDAVLKREDNYNVLMEEFTHKGKDPFALVNYYYQQNEKTGSTNFLEFKSIDLLTPTEIPGGFAFALKIVASFDYNSKKTAHDFTFAIACNLDKSLNNLEIIETKMKP